MKTACHLLIALISLLLCAGCRSHARLRPVTAANLLNGDRPLVEAAGGEIDRDRVSLRVQKSRYVLTVIYAGRPLKEYPIVLGRNPVDDKLREGDGCTPEGRFTIRALYPHRQWSRFLWLDYPTAESWRKFARAKREGRVRPNARIGGEVGIHGVPAGADGAIDRRQNWTLGCVSLKTTDIAEIYDAVRRGTRVEIVH